MLDEQEWERVQPLLRVGLEETKARREEHATTLEDVDMATTYVRALDAFEALTGERPTDPFAMWHHRRADFGSPCPTCGRLLRSPSATQCVECPGRRMDR